MTWWQYIILVYAAFGVFCYALMRTAKDADNRIDRLGREPRDGNKRGIRRLTARSGSPAHRRTGQPSRPDDYVEGYRLRGPVKR